VVNHKNVSTLRSPTVGFSSFFLVVHERHRLRHSLRPGWIIFIQFYFIIKITKVMIHELVGTLKTIRIEKCMP